MTLSLKKNSTLSLKKQTPISSLRNLIVGLGWDVGHQKIDLDVSCFLLTARDTVENESGFIFYNQPLSACSSVRYHGDNRTGAGDGDDEVISVNLDTIPGSIQSIAFVVTINEYEEKQQNFGLVQSAYIRTYDQSTNKELCRYDLSEDYSTSTAVIMGRLVRTGEDWDFQALGQGLSNMGLGDVAQRFGVNL